MNGTQGGKHDSNEQPAREAFELDDKFFPPLPGLAVSIHIVLACKIICFGVYSFLLLLTLQKESVGGGYGILSLYSDYKQLERRLYHVLAVIIILCIMLGMCSGVILKLVPSICTHIYLLHFVSEWHVKDGV